MCSVCALSDLHRAFVEATLHSFLLFSHLFSFVWSSSPLSSLYSPTLFSSSPHSLHRSTLILGTSSETLYSTTSGLAIVLFVACSLFCVCASVLAQLRYRSIKKSIYRRSTQFLFVITTPPFHAVLSLSFYLPSFCCYFTF